MLKGFYKLQPDDDYAYFVAERAAQRAVKEFDAARRCAAGLWGTARRTLTLASPKARAVLSPLLERYAELLLRNAKVGR